MIYEGAPAPGFSGENIHSYVLQKRYCVMVILVNLVESAGVSRKCSRWTTDVKPTAGRNSGNRCEGKTEGNESRVSKKEQAAACGIPEGYSLKSWEAGERPVFVLGSVFDANSAGKWMFDWTVYRYGGDSPMADMAGDMWTTLIRLASRSKRCRRRGYPGFNRRDQITVCDFARSAHRLWAKLEGLLGECERYMMITAQKGRKGEVLMGTRAGVEFVETMFGRDRQLENTQQWMASARMWNVRFAENCADLVGNGQADAAR